MFSCIQSATNSYIQSSNVSFVGTRIIIFDVVTVEHPLLSPSCTSECEIVVNEIVMIDSVLCCVHLLGST